MTPEEIGSQVALEYGQAMTVRVCKADGETMRASGAGLCVCVWGGVGGCLRAEGALTGLSPPQPWWWCRTRPCWS